MNIKKIYLKNFKGIKEKKIVDFSNNTSLLIGPNGFGKTTIFDAIELCLTGEINRTIEKKGVTNDSSDYKKPFYQNNKNEDVILKLWLEKENKDFIIVKYFDKNNDGKSTKNSRRYKPTDFKILETFQEKPEGFEDDFFNKEGKKVIEQSDIDKFFNIDSKGISINDIYKLFNYLQQEDTTYFLKKSEKSRKDSLGFLFQTKKQEEKLDEINKSLTNLNIIKENIESKKQDIEKNINLNNVDYFKLFKQDNFEIDSINPFIDLDLNNSKEKKENLILELDNINKFIKKFSPLEYEKKLKIEDINSILKNINLIKFYILRNFFEKDNYVSLQNKFELLENEENIELYLLQNLINDSSNYINKNNKYIRYKKFIDIKEYKEKIKKLEDYIEDIIPDKLIEYKQLLNKREEIINFSNEIDITINEVLRLRKELKINFEQINNNNNLKCPYCGVEWESYEKLNLSFDKREENLKLLLKNQENKLIDLDKEIENDFIYPITEFIDHYLMVNSEIESGILEKIYAYKNKDLEIKYLKDLEEIFNNKNLVWIIPKKYYDLKTDTEYIKEYIKVQINVSNEVFNEIKNLSNISFEKEIKLIEELIPSKELKHFTIDFAEEKNITKLDLNNKIILMKNYIEEYKSNYKYNSELTFDNDNIYKRYFYEDKEKFNKISSKLIDKKKEFIIYEFSKKSNESFNYYDKRLKEIDLIIKKMKKLKEIYSDTITNYKKNMAKKIKIPFYIYTAKILQNYQQGMGVFLSTKEDSDSIRFLTDNSSDHDAMHHLSSGQLAVVALAFCLAINKTYNISSNLKFLVIDDPIQEMDSLNIHSFIELIRHEFINDYQMIFSTHNDMNALYIKYKFEKFKEDSVNIINVQKKFFID